MKNNSKNKQKKELLFQQSDFFFLPRDGIEPGTLGILADKCCTTDLYPKPWKSSF